MTDNVLCWLSDDELAEIPFSTFWNDEEIEKTKPFHISDGSYEKLRHYLKSSTPYYGQYCAVLRLTAQLGHHVSGIGVDIAAGVCWTSALLSQIPSIKQIYSIDVSKHRLLVLAPHVFDALGASAAKITRVLGSFYDIRLDDGSVDFCFMSQAFHHADEPQRLLREVRRVLKRDGTVLVMGEQPVYPLLLWRRRLANAAKIVLPRFLYSGHPIYRLVPNFHELFPSDREAGDHYYRITDYFRMFNDAGFELFDRKVNGTIFVAVKR